MDAVNDFISDISSYQIDIPLSLQIGIIVFLIVILCVGGYFVRDMFDVSSMRGGFAWFIFVAVLNLVILLVVFLYYNTKHDKYVGAKGKMGKPGRMGKKGSYVSCNLCKSNIYLRKVRGSEIICKLDIYVPEFKELLDTEKYFNNIIYNDNNIDYDSFINTFFFKKIDMLGQNNNEATNKFASLMDIKAIAILLIKTINETTKASDTTYGTFRHPKGDVLHLPLGDCIYGGLEDKLELNSFTVDGNVLYPSNYTQLVSFKVYNPDDGLTNTYTIWRPNGQTINEIGFQNKPEQDHYKALGDICRLGTATPAVKETTTISEKCLDQIDIKNMKLVFIYVGNIQINNEINDYTKTDSYLIENKNLSNNIEIFSIWRTPLNTFLTNCNSQNTVSNNTFIYNIINNLESTLNNYGNVSSETKTHISVLLESIKIPKILSAAIICKYYSIEILKDVLYYINRYQNSVPEFQKINADILNLNNKFLDPNTPISTSANTGGTIQELNLLLGGIKDIIQQYKEYNDNLIKIANTRVKYEKPTQYTTKKNTTDVIDLYKKYNNDLVSKIDTTTHVDIPNQYDASKEKHLPPMVLNVYNNAITKLTTIPVQIENTNTFLDIVNLIFENGIETLIATDSDGIAQGGILMNSIQEMVIRICKVLMPPNTPAYSIKDECLGTFSFDREREEKIKIFTESYAALIKLSEQIVNDVKFQSVIPNVIQYDQIMLMKMGQLCGHIENYLDKILSGDVNEFTTSRIKSLIEIFNENIVNLQNLINNI